jgi:hypothetical protein
MKGARERTSRAPLASANPLIGDVPAAAILIDPKAASYSGDRTLIGLPSSHARTASTVPR